MIFKSKLRPSGPDPMCIICGSILPQWWIDAGNTSYCDMCDAMLNQSNKPPSNPQPSMQYGQHITNTTPFNYEWFNEATAVIEELSKRVEQLEQQLTTKCACGNTAVQGDYLCGPCRREQYG